MSLFKLILAFVLGCAIGAYSSVVYLSDEIRAVESELREIASGTARVYEEAEELAVIERLDSATRIARSIVRIYRQGELSSEHVRGVSELVRSEAEALRRIEGLSAEASQRADQILTRADDVILDLEFYQ